MSGGFFRGTSAEQDTRFSNKQAKLLKSQKFAPELEHLVDMTKVKMDVMRPWIATRVTELLGFEDEVLINFIYGLLDGKVVNGKEVQISLTGFMEKNTAKFMKELWALLISAQKNASGVPQQFLDAKAEETKKKKADTDRIANDILRKKEKEAQELEQERMRLKKMDTEDDISRDETASLEPNSKDQPRNLVSRSADDKDPDEMIGARGRRRVSRSPHSAYQSPSSHRDSRSRSISRSPPPRRRSTSSERVYRYQHRRLSRREPSPQQSISPPRQRRRSTSRPHRRSVSPIRRKFRSPFLGRTPTRHRSRSPTWRLSRSPRRYRSRSSNRYRSRSPIRYRARSPLRHRPRSPVRRHSRSPMRRHSRSPMHHKSRSPMRHRSRSLVRRKSRSPMRRRSRSPLQRKSRSPIRQRSPSNVRRRSPFFEKRRSSLVRFNRSSPTTRQKSASPMGYKSRIAGHKRSPTRSRYISPSSQEWSSQSPVHNQSLSPISRRSPNSLKTSRQVPREKLRDEKHDSSSTGRSHSLSLQSPMKDRKDQNDSHRRHQTFSRSPYQSPHVSESPPARRSTKDRSISPYKSPVKQSRGYMTRDDFPSPPSEPRKHKSHLDNSNAGIEAEDIIYARDGHPKINSLQKGSSPHSSLGGDVKNGHQKMPCKDKHLSERLASHISADEAWSQINFADARKKNKESDRDNVSGDVHREIPDQKELLIACKGTLTSEKPQDGHRAMEKVSVCIKHAKDIAHDKKPEKVSKSQMKVEQERGRRSDSTSEESDEQVREKRKHKRSRKRKTSSDDDCSSDSLIEERKENKRRKKEEKRLRKEERRRKREERRRRREERHAEKRKAKSYDTVSPISDNGRNHVEHPRKEKLHANDNEDMEPEQKRLEIELREMALKNLKAKKGIDL